MVRSVAVLGALCLLALASCTEPEPEGVCGNALIEPDEECDNGANDGSYGTCNADCTLAPFCGDEAVDDAHGELCDDGVNDGSYDTCNPDCSLAAFCGDGAVDDTHGELCDDGTNDGSYGTCTPGCTLAPHCGDAAVDDGEGEACDDGTNDGSYGTCDPDCSLASHCGDGVLDDGAGEACDDGNTDVDDGCDASCQVEAPAAIASVDRVHTPGERAFRVTWDARWGNELSDCQVWVDGVAVGSPVPCTDEGADLLLPWGDGETRWGDSLDVVVAPDPGTPARDGASVLTFDCTAQPGSDVATPDRDEDCDGAWDNTTNAYIYPGALEIWFCNGPGGWHAYDLPSQTSADNCVALCEVTVNDPGYVGSNPYKNCFYDASGGACWIGGTSICVGQVTGSYKWDAVPSATYY